MPLGMFEEDVLVAIAGQFRQGPHQGVHAVWGFRDQRNVVAHLVFEHPEGADVVHAVLFIEGGNRFGTGQLAARSMHGLVGETVIDVPQNGLDQIAAVIDFGDDAVGFVGLVTVERLTVQLRSARVSC